MFELSAFWVGWESLSGSGTGHRILFNGDNVDKRRGALVGSSSLNLAWHTFKETRNKNLLSKLKSISSF